MALQKLAIACQGGGSHTAFTAGVLKRLLEVGIPDAYQLVGLSGTSGGGICAIATWYGLLKAAQGSTEPPYQALVNFWKDNSADSAWEQSWNSWTLQTLRWQAAGLLPSLETTPYNSEWIVNACKAWAPRPEYFDLQALLEKHIHFQEIPTLQQACSPRLLLGAVDILSGTFRTFDSKREAINVHMVLASAAIPTLFKAVELDQTAYWDGLFSENPPVTGFLVDNVEERPDEIWIVRINPQKRSNIPMNAEDIQDRRNELAGNLALNQELRLIELVNQWIDRQDFDPNSPDRFKRIQVRFIDMSPEISASLDYASKLNRSPQFIQQLMEDGEKQAESFLREKDSKQ